MEEHQIPLDRVVNADETAVFFDSVAAKTVDRKGAKSVQIRSTRSEKKRVTCVLAVSRSGTILKPFVIFKGKSIERFRNFNPSRRVLEKIVLSSSDKAWMNSSTMKSWITKCLLPHTQRKPAVLLMDNFSAHKAEDVLNLLEENHVHVVWVPAHCTSVAQPCDVRVNAQFKRALRGLWRERMQTISVEREETKVRAPSREDILAWIVQS
ncbi:MAG: transposase, partial [Bacteroidota bacterium]